MEPPLRRPPAGAAGLRARIEVAVRRVDRRRVLAVVLAIAVALFVRSQLVTAEATVRAFGRQRVVAVATRALPPGHVVGPDDVERRPWPVGLLPASPSVDDPAGRTVMASVLAGEPVVEGRLVPLDGPIRPGERGVTVPLLLGTSPASVGDHVELVGTAAATIGVRTSVLASGRVVAVADESLTVATTASGALRVIEHLARGTVDIVLTPLGGAGPD